MTDERKRFLCEVILQAYDRNVMPESNLRLEKRRGAVIVRGLPFNDYVWFPYGYEEFCLGAYDPSLVNERACSFLEWTDSCCKPLVPMSDVVTFGLAYQSVYNALKDVSSWEELDLRLSIGGFLGK